MLPCCRAAAEPEPLRDVLEDPLISVPGSEIDGTDHAGLGNDGPQETGREVMAALGELVAQRT